MTPPRPSAVMQVAVTLAVLYSFLAAVHGNEFALRLWTDAPEGPVAFLGVGVGIKMTAQTVERWGARKYATRGSVPPGEEP